jgi:nucleoprotein TPR
MKTRRKSKAAAAAVSAEPEQDAGSSQAAEEAVPTFTFSLAIPADIDVETLSNHLPGVSLTSVSAESIITLYKTLLAQVSQFDAVQRDLDEARAEAERKDIELDQALQDRESLAKDLETSLETAHSEVGKLKLERDEIGMFH